MAKAPSEQLAELSVRVKNTETAVAAAQKEAHDKIETRKQQARAAATTAVERVNREVQSVRNSKARDWSTVKAKIAADMTKPEGESRQREAQSRCESRRKLR